MTIYTIHSSDGADQGEDVVLAPEGFSWGAFVFGPVWLLANQLWLWAIFWTALALAYCGLSYALGNVFSLLALFSGGVLLQTLFALEAQNLRRKGLERRGKRIRAVVWAKRADAAAFEFYKLRSHTEGTAKVQPDLPVHAPGSEGSHFLSMFPSEQAP